MLIKNIKIILSVKLWNIVFKLFKLLSKRLEKLLSKKTFFLCVFVCVYVCVYVCESNLDSCYIVDMSR
jgi:hypothetical protein